MIYPLFKKFLDMRYDAFNSYIYNEAYDDTITICVNYEMDNVNTGYETIGFTNFDKYLREHKLFMYHKDHKDYISYTMKLPNELLQYVSDIWYGDYEFITKNEYREMSKTGQEMFNLMRSGNTPLNKYKTYERTVL